MRWFWLTVLAGMSAQVAPGPVNEDVRDSLDAHNFARAEQYIQAARAKNGVTPELLEALSWLGRGELDAKQYDQAERYAAETRKLALEALAKRKMDDERHLPIALGASIEMHAQVLAARGERAAAVVFLRQELAAYRNTSIATRIQKNINLLTLEGKPAPPLEVNAVAGTQTAALGQLKGHPVLAVLLGALVRRL